MDEKLTIKEALELAEYKIGEMLNFGCFDEAHAENFRRAHEKIKSALESA